jgi:hypothetical protein
MGKVCKVMEHYGLIIGFDLFRIRSIDIRYQVWKWGVIFTDNVSDESDF